MQKECIVCKKKYDAGSNSQKTCNDCKKRECKTCGKEFTLYHKLGTDHKGFYCSQDCYLKGRFKQSKECLQCGKVCPMRFCCRRCQLDFWNANGYDLNKKKRHWERKFEILKRLGGKCIKCGIDDIRVLDINHKDRSKKERPKNKSKTYTWEHRLMEWNKNIDNVEILCANCHRLHTWEQMGYGKY